jgi:hypothetical protein
MKKQYLVNTLLILIFALSPMGRVSHSPVIDDTMTIQVFMPFIGNSMPLAIVHKQNTCGRAGSQYIVRGDITSLVDQAFYDVILEGRAYNREGQLLGTTIDHPIMTATLMNQLNHFEIGFNAHCWEASYSNVEIKSWSTDSPQVYWPATLVYTSTVEDFGHGTRVTAEFRNDAGLPMHDITGLAWSIHEEYYFGPLRDIADSLAPGETITYTEYLEGIYAGWISTIEVAAQGVIEP